MSHMIPVDYILMQRQRQPPPPPPPPPRPPDHLLMQRPWQLPPWTGLLGNAAVLSAPPPRIIQPPPRIQLPQIQLALPEWGDFAATRRGGTRTDIAPPPRPAPSDLPTLLEIHQVRAMPPGLREFYSAWLGAGRWAIITPGVDVLARWVRREDPTLGLEEFHRRAKAAEHASPWAHAVGQGVALGGLGGLMAQHLAARGAAMGARGAVEQFVAGLRAGAKPAVAGVAAGAAAGATVGTATGRDPIAEAAKFGTLGALVGLGGVPRERLVAAGLLGGVVGGTTAREHGVAKGLEAGSAVFLLPIAAPERLARGVFTGFTAERRLRTGLLTEPRLPEPATASRVELPTVQDVRMYALLTRRTFSDVVADMARQSPPDARRGLFEDVTQMAIDRIRAGYDRESVFAVLRSVRSKLDPVARREFDEVLRQYGLTEVKHRTPEYALREEDAPALARLFRREPGYALTDEAAALLGRFFGPESRGVQLVRTLSDPGARRIQLMTRSEPELRNYMLLMTRSEPQYVLTDRAAVLLDRLFRQEPALVYSLRTRQDQRQIYAVAPATTQRTTQQTTTTPLQTPTTTTTTDTPPRETTTTPPPETPPRTPPPDHPPRTPPPDQPPRTPPPGTPPYIPPWMLNLPVSIALPLLAQMGLRLPPPPNPNMPLGAYLRMLRFPALGRQREVFVLI